MPIVPFAPQAVVFDLDGLLVDSEPLWERAERSVVESLGGRWTPELQRILIGGGPHDTAAKLGELLGSDPEEVDRRMLAAALEQFGGGVPLRAGAERLVAGLHGRVPLGLATNSRQALADLALASTGLGTLFDAVVAAEDVSHPKPAPDPYLRACALLGAEPARAVALEDSPLGVRSARAAGLWVVGCPSLPSVELHEADAVVASLTDLDPDALLPLPTGRSAERGR